MAEQFNVAFGRYLRTLRERRALALSDVASLSGVFPDPVSKAYLSRCENGRHRLGASKMIALSRIYEVPPKVMLERMELDLELAHLGGPKTEGLRFPRLRLQGIRAFERGEFWEAYAYFRDSAAAVPEDKADRGYRDPVEQLAYAHMNIAGVAALLGRTVFARHEMEHLRATGLLGSRNHVILIHRFALVSRLRGDLDESRAYAEEATALAHASGFDDLVANGYESRAMVAHLQKDYRTAMDLYRKAFRAHERAGRQNDCARTLLNLGIAYLDSGRIAAARRSVESALRLSERVSRARTKGLAHIAYGDIEFRNGRYAAAEKHWKEAAEIARKLNNRMTLFRAEFRLYKRAIERQEDPVIRSIERRLRRRLPWVAGTIEEADDFKRMISPGTS